MDSWKIGELSAVSRYWTPSHIDVTDAPLNYAKPKPAWIDRIPAIPSLARIDEADRFRRRMLNNRLAIEPNEIPELPPIEVRHEEKSLPPTGRNWLVEVRTRFLQRHRLGAVR